MVRWWNGLDWSDARRRADDDIAKVRRAADDAARSSTISPQQVARTGATRGPVRAAAEAVVVPALSATNPFAAGAVAVGIIGLLFGLFGVLPAIGLVVSLLGLVRSRRLARDGTRRTGFGQSVAGLVLSLAGLVRWLPLLEPLLRDVFSS